MFVVVDIVNVTESEIYFEKDSSLQFVQNLFSVFFCLLHSGHQTDVVVKILEQLQDSFKDLISSLP